MNYFLEFHYAITTVLYPLVNIIVLGAFSYGFLKTPLRKPFAVLLLATIFILVPQGLNLLYYVKSTFDLSLPQPSVVQYLFPIQAVAEYIAFSLDVVGVVYLVIAARKISK